MAVSTCGYNSEIADEPDAINHDSWICVGIWVDGKGLKLASDIHTMLEQSVVNSAQSVVDKVSDEMES